MEELWRNKTEEGHKVFFSEKEDKHEHGVEFLVHKDIVNTVMGCRPVSSRLITIRLRAVPRNITIVRAYVPTADCDDNETGEFYDQLPNVIDQTHKTQFDLEKLKDPNVFETFQAMIGGRFAPLKNHEQRRYRHRFNDHHLQHSSD